MFSNKRSQILFSVVSAAGLWLLLIVLGYLVPNGTKVDRLLEVLGGSSHGIIQALIYTVFIYSLFELKAKRSFIQKEQEGFDLGLLPLQDQLVITPDEVAQIKLKTLKIERTGHTTLVGDFVKKACTQYRNDNSIGETLQVFNAQVDVRKEAMEGDLEIVRYLLGAIISLGFIGTLIGLSSSIGLAHLSKTAEGMPIITRSLNVAFDTTLVALLAGLILNFLYHRYLKEMDTFFSEAKSYVINNLISRIYVRAHT